MAATRRQIAKAFRDCIPFLAANHAEMMLIQPPGFLRKTEYICFALDRASERMLGQSILMLTRDGKKKTNPYAAAAEILEERLLPVNNMESWLISKNLVNEKDLYARQSATYDAIQAHRHAWVKELIKEFGK